MDNHEFAFAYRKGLEKIKQQQNGNETKLQAKDAVAQCKTGEKQTRMGKSAEGRPSDILFDAHTAVRGLCDMLSKSHLSASS